MSELFHKYSVMRDWYKRSDDKYSSGGAVMIDPREATKANEAGFAIAWTVNYFDKEPRRKENLKKILSFAIDMDKDSKKTQMDLIKKFIHPSTIIESKNGFHVYFNVKDANISADEYRIFIVDRLIDKYNSDAAAADVTRLLRVPFLNHLKDRNNPFMVNLIHADDTEYSYEQLCKLFPENPRKKRLRELVNHMRSEIPELEKHSGSYGIFEMDQMEALKKVSGHDCVNGETISFKPISNNRYKIYVNGKQTSAWIDEQRQIGSPSFGGPTVFQWINWYQNDKNKTAKFISEIFKGNLNE